MYDCSEPVHHQRQNERTSQALNNDNTNVSKKGKRKRQVTPEAPEQSTDQAHVKDNGDTETGGRSRRARTVTAKMAQYMKQ